VIVGSPCALGLRLIEEPDSYNGKNGYRIISEKGRTAVNETDILAAKARNQFPPEVFHSSLPDAAWNSFRSGDYDTAVFEEPCILQPSCGPTD
jgi:hypothetical protein